MLRWCQLSRVKCLFTWRSPGSAFHTWIQPNNRHTEQEQAYGLVATAATASALGGRGGRAAAARAARMPSRLQ